MEAQPAKSEKHSSVSEPNPAATSCRKKKKDQAAFLEDVKDHIDEFFSASVEEHKTCFTKTIKKMFGMSKIVAERNQRSVDAEEVESSLRLRTTVAD